MRDIAKDRRERALVRRRTKIADEEARRAAAVPGAASSSAAPMDVDGAESDEASLRAKEKQRLEDALDKDLVADVGSNPTGMYELWAIVTRACDAVGGTLTIRRQGRECRRRSLHRLGEGGRVGHAARGEPGEGPVVQVRRVRRLKASEADDGAATRSRWSRATRSSRSRAAARARPRSSCCTAAPGSMRCRCCRCT